MRSVVGMFSRIAPLYDAMNRVLSLGADTGWRRLLVRVARVEEGERVLDLCTGTGDLALMFARRGARVVGVDLSEGMLARARKRVARSALAGRISLQMADALRLPFADGSFPVVSVAFGLRNLDDPGAGIREMARVVSPGGRLLILEFAPPSGILFGRLFRLYLKGAVPLLGLLLAGSPGAYRYLSSSILGFHTPREVSGFLEAAGLRLDRVRPLMMGAVCLHAASKPR